MDKRILFVLSVIAVIVVGYLLLAMDAQYVMSNRIAEMRFNSTGQPNHLFVPPPVPITFLFILLFLLLTPIILLYSQLQMEKTLSASSELLAKLVSKGNGKRKINEPSLGRELVARLLDSKEMTIIDRLIDQPKGILQTEVVKMPGMTKLKAHRTVERLRQKGVITVQKVGKTNLIKLDNRTRSILSGFE